AWSEAPPLLSLPRSQCSRSSLFCLSPAAVTLLPPVCTMSRAAFCLLLLFSSSALIRADGEEEEDNVTDLVVETVEKPETCTVTVAWGDTIKLHYTGKLDDGRVIDTSLSRDPILVVLGKKQVIKGNPSLD
ncbi:hypothetical protein GDO78_020801, partial [Eleutherodactylus coqui]